MSLVFTTLLPGQPVCFQLAPITSNPAPAPGLQPVRQVWEAQRDQDWEHNCFYNFGDEIILEQHAIGAHNSDFVIHQ